MPMAASPNSANVGSGGATKQRHVRCSNVLLSQLAGKGAAILEMPAAHNCIRFGLLDFVDEGRKVRRTRIIALKEDDFVAVPQRRSR